MVCTKAGQHTPKPIKPACEGGSEALRIELTGVKRQQSGAPMFSAREATLQQLCIKFVAINRRKQNAF
jgi:hypothetical protein